MKIIDTAILLCFLVLTSVSCAKSEVKVDEKVDLEDITVTVSEDSYMSDRTIIKLHGDPGEYRAIFEDADVRIGIASFRYEQTGLEKAVAFYDPKEESLRKTEFASKIRINGKDFLSPASKSGDNSLAEFFGEVVKFDLTRLSLATKGADAEIVEMYVPASLKITFPQFDSENHRAPLCLDRDFVVRWNADKQNENGIMAVVKWNGVVLFGEDYSSSDVVHFKHFPDTGSAMLDDTLFEGIPDTAYCSLFLLRGCVENIDIDNIDYQLLVETQDVLDFVLVRNVIKH
ncbi:hypothetical protein SAMN06298214_0567 [Bacteroidales bacterium WCE2004]|nr:hypothetical protein SAMN06298214_0567 [Bacteroidales bacterium WCE2004]